MLLTVKNKIRNAGLKCRNVLANKSGDQMTGWLIVVLIVVVVGAVFLTLYKIQYLQSGTALSPRLPAFELNGIASKGS